MPAAVEARLERALAQRMYLIDREDQLDAESSTVTSAAFSVLGSTGNVYRVCISTVPDCDCPDFVRNPSHSCKHVLFVLSRVLRVPTTNPILFQKALLSSELQSILVNREAEETLANDSVRSQYLELTGRSPSKFKPAEAAGEASTATEDAKKEGALSTRRPIEEGDECPICFEGLSLCPDGELMWCEPPLASGPAVATVGCGKALHKDCGGRWLTARNGQTTCPFCRAVWGSASSSRSGAAAEEPGSDGYLNLGAMQGLSGRRDTSTYDQSPWSYGGGRGRYGRHGRYH